jgi:hypothetical protein
MKQESFNSHRNRIHIKKLTVIMEKMNYLKWIVACIACIYSVQMDIMCTCYRSSLIFTSAHQFVLTTPSIAMYSSLRGLTIVKSRSIHSKIAIIISSSFLGAGLQRYRNGWFTHQSRACSYLYLLCKLSFFSVIIYTCGSCQGKSPYFKNVTHHLKFWSKLRQILRVNVRTAVKFYSLKEHLIRKYKN